MICKNCNTEIDDNSKFCTKCGKKFSNNSNKIDETANNISNEIRGSKVIAKLIKFLLSLLVGIVTFVIIGFVSYIPLRYVSKLDADRYAITIGMIFGVLAFLFHKKRTLID